MSVLLFFLLKGLLIGFLLALPVGPAMILCVRYSLFYGMFKGFMTGLGSALADAFYGVLVGYGIYAVTHFMDRYHFLLHLIGGILLCYLGWKTARERISFEIEDLEYKAPHFSNLFLLTFWLTATSPLTIIGVTALCAAIGIESIEKSVLSPWMLGAGILMGAGFWWAIISGTTAFFRKRMTIKSSKWLNRISGALLFTIGLAILCLSLFSEH